MHKPTRLEHDEQNHSFDLLRESVNMLATVWYSAKYPEVSQSKEDALQLANLYFAAPDLLAACEKMVTAMTQGASWNVDDAFITMQTAIAKAKGETHD